MPTVSSSRRGRRRLIAEINVVPYIDVMLVLLVIFMVTAPLVPPGEINLASAGQSSAPPDRLVEIRMSANGELRMIARNLSTQFDRTVGERDVVPTLRSLDETGTLPVLIAADQKIPYGDVVRVMDQVRSSGKRSVGLLVRGRDQ
jgi:biopolymer transport protein TolR